MLWATDAGESFRVPLGGQVEAEIDESEGVSKLLSIVAENGPARAGGLVGEWSDYLRRWAAIRSESMTKDTMRHRLINLLAHGLVERKGTLYSVAPGGLARIQEIGDEDGVETGIHEQIWALVRQNEKVARERIWELLHEVNPFTFEHLVKRLLEEMGYKDMEVTARSGDGDVDVVGDIELGIAAVREVVQAKRHRRTIQREDLDALRSSLYRFNAVRGTLVTTAKFSKVANEAAFATGAAPITLVDGHKIVDLPINHGIAIRKSDPVGNFPIDSLNHWEIDILNEEMGRDGFLAWYRNPARASVDALAVAHQGAQGHWRRVCPDFLFFCDDEQEARVSIVDPHGHYLADASPKLCGLAAFAEVQGESFYRVESVARLSNDGLCVLDLTDSEAQDAITRNEDAQALYLNEIASNY